MTHACSTIYIGECFRARILTYRTDVDFEILREKLIFSVVCYLFSPAFIGVRVGTGEDRK